MWPLLLDMTKEESIQNLRNLELEAYSHLVSALRAQGPLSSDKRKLLKDTSEVLNITQERYKAEIRRAISDEKLNTIAYHVTGQTESLEDWAQEGRRIVPLLPRLAPQTAYCAIADEVADGTSQSNKQLPSPSNTERKRSTVPQQSSMVMPESSKSLPFRIPEPPKQEESKKRKLPICSENSSLVQHLLLGPSKVSRIQQLYRQKTKSKTKEQSYHLKYKQDHPLDQQERMVHQPMLQHPPIQHHQSVQQHQSVHQLSQQLLTKYSSSQLSVNGPKINVLQNISVQSSTTVVNDPIEQHLQSCSNENQAPARPKIIANLKPNITLKQITSTAATAAGSSSEMQKTIKMCPSKKTLTKTVSSGQKLLVVSTAQSIPSSSILQKTLSLPFVKNISVKNLEKFKIVTSNSTPNVQVPTLTSANNANSVKHKVVTVKTNSATKKVIPFSQLQVLNPKGGIKVLPLGGKIVGKSVSSTAASPLYIMSTANVQTSMFSKPPAVSQSIASNIRTHELNSETSNPSTIVAATVENSSNRSSPNRENGKSSVLEDILKASGVIAENAEDDYDSKIDEYHISQRNVYEVPTKSDSKTLDDVKDGLKDEYEDTNGTIEVQTASDFYKVDENYGQGQILHAEHVQNSEVIEEEQSIKSSSDMLMDTTEDVVIPFSDNLPQVVLQVESSTANDINELN